MYHTGMSTETQSDERDSSQRPGPLEMEGSSSSIGFMLSKVGAAVAEKFHDLVGEFGLVPRQFFVLNLISQHEGESQQAIAESIGVAKSQMVAVVDELEQKKLLERRTNPNDRRQHALYLTKAGLKLRDKTLGAAVELEDYLRSALSEDEADVLVSALRKLAVLDGTPMTVHGALAKKLENDC